MNLEKKILGAKILKPHGIKGSVKIKTFIENWNNLFTKAIDCYGVNMGIISCRPLNILKNEYIITINGINSLEEVNLIINKELFISSEDLPQLPDENTYYYYQLINLPLKNEKEELVGYVQEVYNINAGDILLIKTNMGRTCNLPFESNIISQVQLGENGYLRITPAGETILFY